MSEPPSSLCPTKEVSLRVCFLLACISWGIFNFRSNFIPSWGTWYSQELIYQLQSLAFSHHKLALVDTPQGIARDWAWANGAYQVWGLGVPALMHLGSLLNNIFPIPDRLLFSILWVGIITLLGTSVARQGLVTVFWVTLLPALISPLVAIVQTRMATYEIAILWGAILSIGFLGSILLSFKRTLAPPFVLFAGLYAGYLPNVRPTLFAYTIAGWCIYAFFSPTSKVKNVLLYSAGAAIGIATLAYTNLLRFGHILEFGHSLNVFGNEMVMLVMKWPSSQLPYLWDNFLDFFHALFTYQGNTGYVVNPFLAHPELHRFREFYFRLVTSEELAISGICCLTAIFARGKAQLVAFFALLSAGALFVFYLLSSIFSSRYLVDFTPALCASFIALVLLAHGKNYPSKLFSLLLAFIFCYILSTLEVIPLWYAKNRGAVAVEQVIVHGPNAYALYPLPGKSIECPIASQNFYTHPDLLQELGWDVRNSCRAQQASGVILTASRCISLTGHFTTPDEFAAKAGLQTMQKTVQNGRRVTFCLDKKPEKDYEVYFVRYTESQALSARRNELHRIEAIEE